MLSSLSTALSGLYASRAAVENVSNNVANEHNAGYKKRIVNTSEIANLSSNIYGNGVNVDGVSRTVSQYMYDNIMVESAKKSYYTSMSKMLGDIESVFKETDTSGFSHDLNRYFQSVENLRSNPDSQVYKTDLRNQGAVVVDTLNRLYDGVEAQEKVTKKSLERDVLRVNELLEEMGKINKTLDEQHIASNVLLDRRDLLEKELGLYVDIEVDRGVSDYILRIGGEVALRLGSNVRTFTVSQSEILQKDVYLEDDGQTSSLKFSSGVFNANDVIRYKFDNDTEVSIKFDEHVDLNNDGNVDAGETADNTNYIRLLKYKINNDPLMNERIVAYNGTYQVDSSGNKVTNDTKDNYLLIESKEEGPDGRFNGRIVIEEYNDAIGTTEDVTNLTAKKTIYKDDYQSSEGSIAIDVFLFDRSVNISSGSIKAYIENLKTDSGKNQFQKYKDTLDQFAKTFSDLTSQFVKNDDGSYLYGQMSIDSHKDGLNNDITKNAKYIGNVVSGSDEKPDGLFSGASVRSLRFNKDVVAYLDQTKLDYLSKLQWKEDISFKNGTQGVLNAGVLVDRGASSFADYFQRLNLDVSTDKANNDFLLETQEVVIFSLEESYNRIVKVDKDEEMLDLIKFQAAYAANAKVITTLDEMIKIMLGLKR